MGGRGVTDAEFVVALHATFCREVRLQELKAAMDYHDLWWGVPCGPTLSMVRPPRFRG